MWDDAVLLSARTGKPALAFDLDLVTDPSIKLAKEVIASKQLQAFIRSHFEPAMNDFAVDPPSIVGLDSLRNLGWRLTGLEKDYMISVRPSVIVIGPNKKEIDRIVFPEKLDASQLEARLKDILAGRNTIGSEDTAFWRDTTSVEKREHLITMFEERSKYDSVLYHLSVLAARKDMPELAKTSALRYAWLRLQVEGKTAPIEHFISTLGRDPKDSSLHYEILQRLLDHFKHYKMNDSISSMYERIMAFTGQRDPDLLNDYAWQIGNYSKDMDHAYALINEAISKKAHDPDYYDTRALIDGRMQRYDAAILDEDTALHYAEPNDRSYFEGQLRDYKMLKADVEKAEAERVKKPMGKK